MGRAKSRPPGTGSPAAGGTAVDQFLSHRARLEEQAAAGADQTASDADQTASDADQTASDADQTASERDDADASSDQASADLDQASADAGHHGTADTQLGTYETSRAARAANRVDRLATHESRATSARGRLSTATTRDATADQRDVTAHRREQRAMAAEDAIAASNASLRTKFERLRAQAALERAAATADRARAAADRAAATAERARLEAELHGAYLDDLTGAFRREIGWQALSLEIDRSRRGDCRFVLAFVDVDGMKDVNDRDGHAAGDLVLTTLVRTMRASLRTFDPIVRFGGDEFVCGVAGADAGDVQARLEQVGRTLRSTVGAGISVGVAALERGETLRELVARADAILIDVKRSHRG